jgi:hypothetical protein
MRTYYVRIMQVVLMAGLAASQSNTTTMASTTTNGTGVRNTTAAIQITTPAPSNNKTFCGFFWGNAHSEAGPKCEFYLAMDIGWAVCFGIWWLCFIVYLIMWGSGMSWNNHRVEAPCSSNDSIACTVAALCELVFTMFWPLAVAAPIGFFMWTYCFPGQQCGGSMDPAPAGGGGGATTQTAPPNDPVVPQGAAQAKAQFNQRFPKIAPGDCRPKYSRVQTSAC